MLVMSNDAGPKLLENMGLFLKNVERIEVVFESSQPVKVHVTAYMEEKHINLLYQLVEQSKAFDMPIVPESRIASDIPAVEEYSIGIYSPHRRNENGTNHT